MRRSIEYSERPTSEQLVDLHVYIVPPEIWRGRYNDVLNSQINKTISAGFLRVDPQLKIYGLREEIDQQIGIDVSLLPREYVFLKSVGRSLTRVKPKQEYQLKVKNFIPPQAYLPEIFVLELTPEIKAAFSSSVDDSSRSITRTSTHPDDSARLPSLYHRQHAYDTDADSGLYENDRCAPMSIGGAQMAYSGQPGTHGQYQSPSSAAYRQGYPQGHPQPYNQSENSAVDSAPIQSQSTPLPNSSAPSPGYHSNSNIDHRQPLQPPSSHSRHNSASRGAAVGGSEHLPARPGFTAYDQIPKIPTDNQNKEILTSHFNETERLGDISRSPLPYRHGNQVEPMGYPNLSRQSPPSRDPSDVDANLQPLSATPPRSPEKEQHYGSGIHSSGKPPRSPRTTTDQLERGPLFTDSTNDDSGIAGFTPDHRYNRERYDVNDRHRMLPSDERKARSDKEPYDELENHLGPGPPQSRRKRGDLHDDHHGIHHDLHDNMLDDEDEERWQQQERLRLGDQNERMQQEDADRIAKQGSAREQQENDERHLDEERRRLEDERQALIDQSNELLNDYANPPGDIGHQLTEEEKQQKKQNRERLQAELDAAREARRTIERQREDLVKKAKLLQTKTQNRRNHARDVWKKKYFEEKKRTGPLEEQTNRLRHELDQIHRKLMSSLEGSKDNKINKHIDNTPSQQNNFKIQATRLQHEIEDLRRRVDNSKMKLTAEMKLRNQAENELRSLRADLTQKKINLTLTRSQQMASLLSSQDMNVNHNIPRHMITPRS